MNAEESHRLLTPCCIRRCCSVVGTPGPLKQGYLPWRLGGPPCPEVTRVGCLVKGLLRRERDTASVHSRHFLVHGDQHRGSSITFCSDLMLHLLCHSAKKLMTVDLMGFKGGFHIYPSVLWILASCVLVALSREKNKSEKVF